MKIVLISVAQDLESIRKTAEIIDDRPEYAAEKDALRMIMRALCSVVADVQEAIDILEKEGEPISQYQ